MFLEDRVAFPPGETVGIRVTADIGQNRTYVADVGIVFSPSPIEMVLDPDVGSVVDPSAKLVLDFTDSYTDDGVVVGGEGWEWEWEWECVVPEGWGEEEEEGEGEERGCRYEGGKFLEMPEGGRFEGEEGERLREGVPMFWVVRVRVRSEEGEIVGEEEWSRVLSPVGGGRGEEEGGWGVGSGGGELDL